MGFEGVSAAFGCCLQPLGEQAGGFHRAGFFPGRGEPQTCFGVLELATFPKRLGGSHWTVTSGGLRRDQPRAGVVWGQGSSYEQCGGDNLDLGSPPPPEIPSSANI